MFHHTQPTYGIIKYMYIHKLHLQPGGQFSTRVDPNSETRLCASKMDGLAANNAQSHHPLAWGAGEHSQPYKLEEGGGGRGEGEEQN